MKKIFIGLLLFCGCTPTFKADTMLVSANSPQGMREFYRQEQIKDPFLVIYQKSGRTLVLLAADHSLKSLPVVHYAFSKYHPQVALIEREPGFPLQGRCKKHEDAYTAALSAKNNIPLVRADADYERQWNYAQKHGFSYEDFQMFFMIRKAAGIVKYEGKQPSAQRLIQDYEQKVHNPAWGKLFTEDRLLAYFQQHYNKDFNTTDFISFYKDLGEASPKKWVLETPFYKISNGQPDVRSVFMLENITIALNNYQVVFSEMGASHFIDMHKALKKMMGKPLYIQADQIAPQEIWQDCSVEDLQEKVFIED